MSKLIKGVNDLATVKPDLVKEWHSTKNGNLKPTEITYKSKKKVWWKCSKGHEYEAAICNRSNGSGCPYCSNMKVLRGYNDLATLRPDLVKEWHPTKNGDLKPTDVTSCSHKKVWWLVQHDVPDDYFVEHLRGKHFDFEWESYVSSRRPGCGCPFLSGHAVWQGYNDLATVRPDLAKEWHPTKNGDLQPTDVTKWCRKKVWWKCSEGHEWEVAICNRLGCGCPVCKESRFEKLVRDYLTRSGCIFSEQIKFEDLLGVGNRQLSYDFAVYMNEQLYALIECQGLQHYKPVEFFGGKERFKIQKIHDKLKREYAANTLNVLLIEIPYHVTEQEALEMLKFSR